LGAARANEAELLFQRGGLAALVIATTFPFALKMCEERSVCLQVRIVEVIGDVASAPERAACSRVAESELELHVSKSGVQLTRLVGCRVEVLARHVGTRPVGRRRK